MEVNERSRVTLCNDGKYRWIYEFEMLKNFSILFQVFKVALLCALAPFLVVFLTELFSGRFVEGFLASAKVFFLVAGIMLVLSFIAYIILAFIYGFKYIVLFVMDEDEVEHIMQDKQATKAMLLGYIEALVGSLSKDPGMMGGGLLVSSHTSITSLFINVRKVIGIRSRNLIMVNGLFTRNQVYVEDEDYDFVFTYIAEHCMNAKIYEK